MRPLLLAACVCSLVLLGGSAHAQVAPPKPSDAPSPAAGARMVMDAVFWATPGDDTTACLQLPPGRMTLTLRLEAGGEPQPVRYRFAPYWYRAADAPSEIDVDVTGDPRTVEATLAGGRYCYSITNRGGPPADAEVAGSLGQAQLVAVRLSLTP
jgi:hypothetical protein